MDQVRYQGSREIRKAGFWALFAMMPGISLAVSGVLSFKGGFSAVHLLVLFVVILVLTTPLWLVIAGRNLGSTTVDDSGLHARAILTRRDVLWQEITSFEVYEIPGRSSNAGYILRAQLAQGQPVPLPGLYAIHSDDPKLVADTQAIRSAWIAATATRDAHQP